MMDGKWMFECLVLSEKSGGAENEQIERCFVCSVEGHASEPLVSIEHVKNKLKALHIKAIYGCIKQNLRLHGSSVSTTK